MIRLAVVSQRYNPYGSPERLMFRALSALHANGKVDVTLIARRWVETGGFQTLHVDQFAVTRTGRERSFARAAPAYFGRFDLVQSHERVPGAQIFRAANGVHATWLEQAARTRGTGRRLGFGASRYDRYLLEAEAAVFRDASLQCVLCGSRMVAEDIARRFGVDPGKIALVYNGSDPVLYNPGLVRHRAAWRAQHGVAPEAPLLAYAGSSFLPGGLTTALAAVASIPHLHLAVAGTDRKPHRYSALAARLGVEDRVRFLGIVPNIRPLYGAADAFILPSLYAPFPTACAEAFAAGLPVFTSPMCGGAEWVRQGENGWVVDALDVAGYRTALTEWLDRRPEWPAMRAAAHKVAEPYTLSRMIGELDQLYQRLTSA
jgi:UDP-glucose:(heptosyl)LPS alpha-1,3-glucosyltransferase